jgi:hypothetical protein
MKRLMLLNAIGFGLAVLLLSSCGGTEAGNPKIQSTNTTAGPALDSLQIQDAICNKLAQCYPTLSYSQCTSGIGPETNLPQAFGLSPLFGTFSDMVTAENNGAIHPEPSRATACLSDINSISCIAPSATTSYSSATPSDFSNVINLIPTSGTSCAGVF